MRIAIFTNGFPERPDGDYTPAVIETLCRLGEQHDITVFAFGGARPQNLHRAAYRFGPLEVVATGSMTKPGAPRALIWLWRQALRRHRQAPYACVHGLWHVGGLLAVLFGLRTRRPMALSMLGGEIVRLPQISYGVATRMHWRWLLRWCFRRAHTITAGSPYYLEKILAFAPHRADKLELAPLGIAPQKIPVGTSEPRRPVRLLTVAALQPVKNFPALFELLRPLGCDTYRLTIAGTGPLAEAVQGNIEALGLQENVRLAGWQPADSFRAQYAQHDLLLALSLHEAQGMALVEAGAAGLPIVTTRVGAAQALADLGAAVVFCEPQAAATAVLAEAISRLPDLQRRARRAAPKIRAAYDLEKAAARFTAVYAAAVHKHDARPWYRFPMPIGLRLRRVLRPLTFQVALPLLAHWRKKNADTVVAGMRLHTRREVFHPKYFLSSRLLAQHLAARDLSDVRVLDMGTGSGIVGIFAARQGAEVTAVDVNPQAVQLAQENARLHLLNGRFTSIESDLFAKIPRTRQFDVIAFNPPFFAGTAKDVEWKAFYAGEEHETIEQFLAQAARYLSPSGRIILILSSDMPLQMLDQKFARHGYRLVAHRALPDWFEVFHIVELAHYASRVSDVRRGHERDFA